MHRGSVWRRIVAFGTCRDGEAKWPYTVAPPTVSAVPRAEAGPNRPSRQPRSTPQALLRPTHQAQRQAASRGGRGGRGRGHAATWPLHATLRRRLVPGPYTGARSHCTTTRCRLAVSRSLLLHLASVYSRACGARPGGASPPPNGPNARLAWATSHPSSGPLAASLGPRQGGSCAQPHCRPARERQGRRQQRRPGHLPSRAAVSWGRGRHDISKRGWCRSAIAAGSPAPNPPPYPRARDSRRSSNSTCQVGATAAARPHPSIAGRHARHMHTSPRGPNYLLHARWMASLRTGWMGSDFACVPRTTASACGPTLDAAAAKPAAQGVATTTHHRWPAACVSDPLLCSRPLHCVVWQGRRFDFPMARRSGAAALAAVAVLLLAAGPALAARDVKQLGSLINTVTGTVSTVVTTLLGEPPSCLRPRPLTRGPLVPAAQAIIANWPIVAWDSLGRQAAAGDVLQACILGHHSWPCVVQVVGRD